MSRGLVCTSHYIDEPARARRMIETIKLNLERASIPVLSRGATSMTHWRHLPPLYFGRR